MDRVFLDANVLFSAAYHDASRLRLLWSLTDTDLVTSSYVLVEVQRNFPSDRLGALEKLLERVEIRDAIADERSIHLNIELDSKDRPVLLSAIAARATHLLTGDLRHFRHLFGQTVSGVRIMKPMDYIASRRH